MDLKSAFLGSLSPDTQTRQAAEKYLESIQESEGTGIQCLDICLNNELPVQNLLGVSIYVKNGISRGIATGSRERGEFKVKLMRAIAESPLPVQKILATVVSMLLADGSFLDGWPELLPTVSTMLDSSNPSSVHAAVLCIIEVLRCYRWQSQFSTAASMRLTEIITRYSSKLVSMASPLIIQDSNESAGEMIWKILKFFHMAIARELVEPLQKREYLDPWIELFLCIFNRSLNEQESVSWAKCEKWALKNINTLFIRYGSISSDRFSFAPVYESFRSTFTLTYAPEILKHYLSQVQEYANHNRSLSDSSKNYLLQFFRQCISVDSLWDLLLSNLELVFVSLVFDVLRLKESDIQDLDSEPDQFLYTHNDNLQGGGGVCETPQLAAISFVKELFCYRSESVFNGILIIINHTMESHRQDRQSLDCSLDKDCGLRIMCAISESALASSSPIEDQMETFMTNYVIPDFRSSFNFLRSRACEVIQNYSKVNYSRSVISEIYDGVIDCLMTGNIVISIDASLALHKILSFDYVQTKQSTSVCDTMKKMLDLCSSDTGSELLSDVMIDFVELFSVEILSFGVQLCQGLSNQVMENLIEIQHCSGDGEKVDYAFIDDKVNASQAIMNTIITTVFSMEGHHDAIHEAELTLSPVLIHVFNYSEIELYPECFELIDAFITTRKSVSPSIWIVFEAAYYNFKREPENCITELLPCMQNLAIYGLSHRLDYLPFFEEVGNYGINDEDYENSQQNGLELFTIIVFRSNEEHFQFNNNLVEMLSGHLKQGRLSRFEINLLLSLLFNDPTRTLLTLNNLNCLDAFFMNQSHIDFLTGSGRRIFVLANLKLLSISGMQNDSVSNYLPIVFQNLVKETGILYQKTLPTSLTSFIQQDISFVDESQNWRHGFSTQISDGAEEGICLQHLIESHDILRLYQSTMRYLVEQNKGNYERFESTLSSDLKNLHFILLSQP